MRIRKSWCVVALAALLVLHDSDKFPQDLMARDRIEARRWLIQYEQPRSPGEYEKQ